MCRMCSSRVSARTVECIITRMRIIDGRIGGDCSRGALMIVIGAAETTHIINIVILAASSAAAASAAELAKWCEVQGRLTMTMAKI